MKSLIILISTAAITLATPAYYQYHGPPAPIGHDGRVVDTPEVARAKAAHLTAVAEAAAKTPTSYAENQDHYGYYSKPVSVGHQMHHSGNKYHGPPAPLDDEGRVMDTPEVARARAAHLAAYNHIAFTAPVDDRSQIYKPSSVYSHDYRDSMAPSFHDDGSMNRDPEETHEPAHLTGHADAFDDHDSYDDY